MGGIHRFHNTFFPSRCPQHGKNHNSSKENNNNGRHTPARFGTFAQSAEQTYQEQRKYHAEVVAGGASHRREGPQTRPVVVIIGDLGSERGVRHVEDGISGPEQRGEDTVIKDAAPCHFRVHQYKGNGKQRKADPDKRTASAVRV